MKNQILKFIECECDMDHISKNFNRSK